MPLFEDIGFDLLPKVPVPGITPVSVPEIETSPIIAASASTIAEAAPDPKLPKKGGSALGWFFFGLFVLGTIGATIYIANKDSTLKENDDY